MLGAAARRVRPATAFPFVLGVFTGTLITAFLCLALRSLDEDGTTVSLGKSRESHDDIFPREEGGRVQQRNDANVVVNSLDKPKQLVSFNVLSSKEQLRTRGLSILYTWGEEVRSNLELYLSPPGQEEEISFAFRKKIPIASLDLQNDFHRSGTSNEGVFKALKDICRRKLGLYQWFVKLQDVAYVRTTQLEKLLKSLNSSTPFFLGRPVKPVGHERDTLGLREGQYYCSEGGYVLSSKTLELVCPTLQRCWDNMQSENEDVELAKCIRIHAKVNCTSARQMQELFYHAEGVIAMEELQMGEHRLNPFVKRAVLLSPLPEPEHFYHLHLYYTKELQNNSKTAVAQLRAHVIQTAEQGMSSSSLSHSAGHQTPQWTRLGINPPFLPQQAEDLITWQSFDSNYHYTGTRFHPNCSMSSQTKEDMKKIFKSSTSNLVDSDEASIDGMFHRIDPQRGIDYFFQVAKKSPVDQYQNRAKFFHVLREAEPPQVISLHDATYKTTKVNFVVPTPPVSRAFQRFMMSFETNFLARKPPEIVSALVILYSDGQFRSYNREVFAAATLVDLYKKKYPEADLRLISTRRAYSRKETMKIASQEYPSYELLFLADIHVDFSYHFLDRCRMNTVDDQQVYFPVVFSLYNPAKFYKTRILRPFATKFQISEDQGTWMQDNFHLMCIYNYDLLTLLDLGTDLEEGEWNMLDLVIRQSKLRIFRSVEPGLVHLWQDECKDEELGERERKLCNQLQLE